MSSNKFGEIFSITTWGESHVKAIGVVIDGCPAGIKINDDLINKELERRSPGQNPYTSPRNEKDKGEILSGVFEGVTTGTPVSIVIWNKDADSSKYEPIKDILRTGHANYGYLEKYGVFDYRGGGRASARETAVRVAAGAVARAFIKQSGIEIVSYVSQVKDIVAQDISDDFNVLKQAIEESTIFCPDKNAEQKMIEAIIEAKKNNDSLGGVVEFCIKGVPTGLGDPVYQKLDMRLSAAMMSIPASKAVEIGSGFSSILMTGKEHNDIFTNSNGSITTKTNNAGGIIGGISTAMPITGRIAFKPTSSIAQPQPSIDIDGNSVDYNLPKGSRHDPCVALRAAPIVEAMASLVIADALLMNRSSKA